MVLVLKKGATKKDIEEIDKILYKEKSKGGFDAKKNNGIIPDLEDGMVIQKRMIDEWKRDI
ncbi:hypothetical protein NAF17_01765 [Mucilaginibacter sp. RB4R14]|uniref:hypothetical protein n=1 Tax=Mucilaginibacter aurantiaciroseus TaxID=2949308 RepID=UPI0020914C1A|nr:hypothetical protein [Mucilaginibacter aurantiaciroseus]MCO5934252.1 hypothetical protein [Mucilaginibacter aurantiaciroseus]